MIKVIKILAATLAVVCSMGFIGFSQSRIDSLYEEALEDELLYIPNKTLLSHFTAGMSNVVADLLWIETIQYTVKEFHNPERKFAWLEHMCHAAADLDPYFEGVYVHGGMFLSSIGADEEALNLLKVGFERNPDSWRIPHEIVKVYMLNRRDDPESPAVAVHYLRMLAERHEHPKMYLDWARRIQEQNDLKGEARAIWEDVLANSKDEFIRELAEHNLRMLVTRDNVDTLNDLAEKYALQTGRKAGHLGELVESGLLVSLPLEDDHGAYFIDRAGVVQHTILVQEQKDRMLVGLNSFAVDIVQKKGRKASSLEEWVEWVGKDLPEHPVPGETWGYDLESGRLY